MTYLRFAMKIALLLLLAVSSATGKERRKKAKKKGPEFTEAQLTKFVEFARGNFDMSKNARPFQVVLILDQEENRYPSFWCGKNVTGKTQFYGKFEMIDGKPALTHAGGFTVQITNAARKLGMFDVIPGGVWVPGLRERNFRITVEKVTDAKFKTANTVRTVSGKGLAGTSLVVYFDVVITGKVEVGEKSAPFKGTATLGFLGRTPAFKIHAKFPLPGKELGLEGTKGQGIVATMYTASVPSAELPKLPDDPAAESDDLFGD